MKNRQNKQALTYADQLLTEWYGDYYGAATKPRPRKRK